MILRFGPIVVVNVSLVVDDGDGLAPGPPVQPIQVAFSELKGTSVYEDLMRQLPDLQAQMEAQTAPVTPTTNRQQRRAQAPKPVKKAPAKKPPTDS